MKRITSYIITAFLLMLCFGYARAQNVCEYDTVINMRYYKVFYSYDICAPSFVIYKLYKGGGNISRYGMKFRQYGAFPHYKYGFNNYDRGHLASAEDFASDRNMLLSTFYYINCIPQHKKLNRSAWRKYENLIRKYSQNDSLIIVCGGCDYNNGNHYIPRNCFKIVYSLKTKKCVYALLFKNDCTQTVSYERQLITQFPYDKIIMLYALK